MKVLAKAPAKGVKKGGSKKDFKSFLKDKKKVNTPQAEAAAFVAKGEKSNAA
jgi:hypothetical protein